jgi:hypothetical protein
MGRSRQAGHAVGSVDAAIPCLPPLSDGQLCPTRGKVAVAEIAKPSCASRQPLYRGLTVDPERTHSESCIPAQTRNALQQRRAGSTWPRGKREIGANLCEEPWLSTESVIPQSLEQPRGQTQPASGNRVRVPLATGKGKGPRASFEDEPLSRSVGSGSRRRLQSMDVARGIDADLRLEHTRNRRVTGAALSSDGALC